MKSWKSKIQFYQLFLITGIILQIYTFIYDQTSVLSFISGCLGIIAVVLCSMKKYSQFLYAIPQLLTYIWLSYDEKLWGEVTINIFYFIMMVITIFTWRTGKYDKENGVIESRSLNFRQNVYAFIGAAAATLILYLSLLLTNDSQPAMDAVTTGPAIIAQILMTLRYKEQWFYWLAIDIASIAMWYHADNACMVMQYIFWTVNCIYGYYIWNGKTLKNGQSSKQM